MAVRKSMLQHQRDIAAAFRGALRCSAWLRTAPREFVVRVKSQLAIVSESHWSSSRSSSWSRQQDSSLIVAARRHIIIAACGRVERTIITSRRLVVAQESLSLHSAPAANSRASIAAVSGGERDSEGEARVFGGERDSGGDRDQERQSPEARGEITSQQRFIKFNDQGRQLVVSV